LGGATANTSSHGSESSNATKAKAAATSRHESEVGNK
jgi:hypothetical protein